MNKMLLFLCVIGQFCYAQNLIHFKMCDVSNGKVKSIKIVEPQQCIQEWDFLENGRISSYEVNGYKFDYEWIGDKEAKCSLSHEGAFMQSDYMYINSFTNEFYDFDAGDINTKLWFNKNGCQDHSVITQNNQSLINTYYYENEDDDYPYKIETETGIFRQVTFIHVLKRDSLNNVIEYSVTCNGQTINYVRNISYY